MLDFFQGFQRAVQAFADREYATCVHEIEGVMAMRATGPNHQLLQMLLISLQRLEDAKAIERFGTQALDAMQDHPWAKALLQITLGQTNLDAILPLAEDDRARCQAYYYAGVRMLVDGRIDDARHAFDASLATQAQCQEWELTRLELEVLRRESVEQCLQAFLRRDYVNCTLQANDLMATGPANVGLVQMLVIGLQRLGQTGTAEDLAGRILSLMSPPPWDTALIRLTLGQTDLTQVLPQADNDRGRSQAHYYAGARFLTLGQSESAREEFEACLALDVSTPERRLAQAEAEPLMRRALAAAEKCHGSDHSDVAIRIQKLATLLQSANRLAEAETLRRREIEIYSKLACTSGNPNPNLGLAVGNYVQLLLQMGLSDEQVSRKLRELGREYGINLAVL